MGCNDSSLNEIYFDNNATTRPLDEVRDEMVRVLGDCFGNPSSAHSAGERARIELRNSRIAVAELLGCLPNQIIFTSSGTESNNMAFYSAYLNRKNGCKIITSEIEHSSIIKMCAHLKIAGAEIVTVKVDGKGIIDLKQLETLLKEEGGDIDLVSIQWVNNETGVVQDINKISTKCAENGVLFHTDAAQAVGKFKIGLSGLQAVDFLSFTAHKLNGPQGCGVLYAKDKFLVNPILFGGFQEEGFRPGTENLPGIAGLGKACEIRSNRLESVTKKLGAMRDQFERLILKNVPEAEINGDTKNRVCNTTNIKFKNVDGKRLTKLLDDNGIRCSQSSACTNFDTTPSYVLTAMGLSEKDAYSSIRFSFGIDNSSEDIAKGVEIIKNSCQTLLKGVN